MAMNLEDTPWIQTLRKVKEKLPKATEPDTDQATKRDEGKDDWNLFPLAVLKPVVRVLMYGAKKYGGNTWLDIKDPQRFYAAAMRHLAADHEGELLDVETGLTHIAHAVCELIFLLYFRNKDMENLYDK